MAPEILRSQTTTTPPSTGTAISTGRAMTSRIPSQRNPDEPDGKGETRAGLHRHGFALEFSGGYLATLNYLQALERLPWRFFWDSVDYEVMQYPRSIVRLKLYTLSLSEDWIGV